MFYILDQSDFYRIYNLIKQFDFSFGLIIIIVLIGLLKEMQFISNDVALTHILQIQADAVTSKVFYGNQIPTTFWFRINDVKMLQ